MYPANILLVFVAILQMVQLSFAFVDPLSFIFSTSMLTSLYYFLNSPSSNYLKENVKTGVHYACQKIGYCEDCEDYWISLSIEDLDFDLRHTLFGQPLAAENIISSIRNHLKSDPERPLMLSFQGPAGTGKNYVASKIAKHMFRKGEKSNYVHFFRSSIDFPLKNKKEEYQERILSSIMTKNQICRRSIFIFDEVEKMPNGILEVLSAVVKQITFKDNDFRRSIFILLSNLGQNTLISETLKTLELGQQREQMDDNRLEKLLANEAFNQEGGLHKTGLVNSLGISRYIPFLPLEKKHVLHCLEHFVKREKQILTKELKAQTLEQLTFGPPPSNKFSFGGCKGVQEKAGYLIERELLRKRREKMLS